VVKSKLQYFQASDYLTYGWYNYQETVKYIIYCVLH